MRDQQPQYILLYHCSCNEARDGCRNRILTRIWDKKSLGHKPFPPDKSLSVSSVGTRDCDPNNPCECDKSNSEQDTHHGHPPPRNWGVIGEDNDSPTFMPFSIQPFEVFHEILGLPFL